MKLSPNTWYIQKDNNFIFKYNPVNFIFAKMSYILNGIYYEEQKPMHLVDMLSKKVFQLHPNPQILEILYSTSNKKLPPNWEENQLRGK